MNKNIKYKDSAVNGIEKIPEHWTTTKVKNNFFLMPSNVDKKSHDDEINVSLCNYVDVYYNNYITNDLSFMQATAKESEIKKFQLKIGDVIITKDSEDPKDIGVPSVVLETFERLVCGYHLSMLRPRNGKVLGLYLFWCLKDPAIASQLHCEATGVTRWAISSRNIKNVIIPLPPLEEQVRISDYLLKMSNRIDRIIQLKFGASKATQNDDGTHNQLNLLIKYRESLIHESVTGKLFVPEIKTTAEQLL